MVFPLFASQPLARLRRQRRACHMAQWAGLRPAFSTVLKGCGTAAGTLVDRGRATEMNLEILEEYIQQEWAPDFHYAHYDGIPWTPS